MLPNGKTLLLALFGKDLSYSRSPSLQNVWAENEKLNLCYLPITASSEQHFVSLVSALKDSVNFLGANITNPYKTVLVEHAQQLGIHCDETAHRIGAANTLFRTATGWRLTNTDIAGITATLTSLGIPCEQNFSIGNSPTSPNYKEQINKNSRAVVLGAGGAAAAVAYTLATYFPQFTLSVFCRSADRAHPYLKATVADFQTANNFDDLLHTFRPNLKPAPSNETEKDNLLLINALPLGQKEEKNPLCEKIILSELSQNPERAWFFDLTYGNPPAVQTAKQLKIKATDGSLMLETQAFKSFSIWRDSLQLEE